MYLNVRYRVISGLCRSNKDVLRSFTSVLLKVQTYAREDRLHPPQKRLEKEKPLSSIATAKKRGEATWSDSVALRMATELVYPESFRAPRPRRKNPIHADQQNNLFPSLSKKYPRRRLTAGLLAKPTGQTGSMSKQKSIQWWKKIGCLFGNICSRWPQETQLIPWEVLVIKHFLTRLYLHLYLLQVISFKYIGSLSTRTVAQWSCSRYTLDVYVLFSHLTSCLIPAPACQDHAPANPINN